MENIFTTTNSNQTKALGKMLAKKIYGGQIICLVGELGSGKTTFTQGLLQGLGVEGPYTSPTFLVMKQYHRTCNMKHATKKEMFQVSSFELHDIYHFDTYRVNSQDILNLGWEEITANEKNVIVVEWADKICDIIPVGAIWINFEWLNEKKRKIIFKSKFEILNKF